MLVDRHLAISATLLVLCCGSTTLATTLNTTNICLLLQNGLSIPNLSGGDCGAYYSCENGVAMPQQCSSGYYFSKDTQNCVLSSQVACTNYGTDPCANRAVGVFMPVAGSCGGYWYCSATGAVRGNCPTGENFNPNKQICAYSSDYPCAVATESGEVTNDVINLCDYIPNGYYFGDPSSCSNWNYCQDNVLHSGKCSSDYEFNVIKMACDYPTNVICKQVTNDAVLVDSIAFASSCTQLGQIKPAAQCNQYFVCDGSNYQLMQCAAGQYFDTVSQICVNRMMARNNCDRCVGTTSTFVNSYSNSSCSGYLICKNGVQQTQNSCPTGYYFNEDTAVCSPAAEPLFGCCNPNAF